MAFLGSFFPRQTYIQYISSQKRSYIWHLTLKQEIALLKEEIVKELLTTPTFSQSTTHYEANLTQVYTTSLEFLEVVKLYGRDDLISKRVFPSAFIQLSKEYSFTEAEREKYCVLSKKKSLASVSNSFSLR